MPAPLAVGMCSGSSGCTNAAHHASAIRFAPARAASIPRSRRRRTATSVSFAGSVAVSARVWAAIAVLPTSTPAPVNRSTWPCEPSAVLRFRISFAAALSSPSRAVNASFGMPASISAGVVPSSEFPTRMFASRNASGLPSSTDSSHSDTFASSAAISLRSTP